MDPFGQLQEEGSRDGWLIDGLSGLVLRLYGCPYARDPVPDEDLGQQLLVIRQCCEGGLPVGSSGSQALCPRLLGIGGLMVFGMQFRALPALVAAVLSTRPALVSVTGASVFSIAWGVTLTTFATSVTTSSIPTISSSAGPVVVPSSVAFSG